MILIFFELKMLLYDLVYFFFQNMKVIVKIENMLYLVLYLMYFIYRKKEYYVEVGLFKNIWDK